MSSTAANVKKTSEATPCKTIRGHTKPVTGVAHLPGGQRIITCSLDSSLRLWDLKSGVQIGSEWRDQGDEEGINPMALSPNGKTIVSGSHDGTVRLWDVETGRVVVKWKGHTSVVQSVRWSPNGGRVVSGSNDGTARVWDVKSSEPVEGLNPIKTGHESVYAVSYSLEASMIATRGYNGSGMKIWDAKTGELLPTIKLGQPVWSSTWTSAEKQFIAALPRACLLDWDIRHCHMAADRCSGPPLQHENDVTSAAVSADGKLLSTAGRRDKNVYTWDIQAVLKTAGLEDLLSIPDDFAASLPHPCRTLHNKCLICVYNMSTSSTKVLNMIYD